MYSEIKPTKKTKTTKRDKGYYGVFSKTERELFNELEKLDFSEDSLWFD